jgi:hypothetical protein
MGLGTSPLIIPSFLSPLEEAGAQSTRAAFRTPERGAVRKAGGHEWTTAAGVHQCRPGHHGPVTEVPTLLTRLGRGTPHPGCISPSPPQM